MAYQFDGSWASPNDLGILLGQHARGQSVPGWIHCQKLTICPSRPRLSNFNSPIY